MVLRPEDHADSVTLTDFFGLDESDFPAILSGLDEIINWPFLYIHTRELSDTFLDVSRFVEQFCSVCSKQTAAAQLECKGNLLPFAANATSQAQKSHRLKGGLII